MNSGNDVRYATSTAKDNSTSSEFGANRNHGMIDTDAAFVGDDALSWPNEICETAKDGVLKWFARTSQMMVMT